MAASNRSSGRGGLRQEQNHHRSVLQRPLGLPTATQLLATRQGIPRVLLSRALGCNVPARLSELLLNGSLDGALQVYDLTPLSALKHP